jgi:ribonuclease Y
MPDLIFYVVSGVLAGLGVLVGWFAQKKVAENNVVGTKEWAETIIEDAKKEAETLKKTAVLEAREEWYREKARFEEDTQARREELGRVERGLEEKEKNINRKVDYLDKREGMLVEKDRVLESKLRVIDQKNEELGRLIEEQNARLEKLANLGRDEAKRLLMENLENEARFECARRIKEIRDEAERTASREAKKILTMAVQRYSADHVVESTVSVVPLPSDEMKGRIIGREGRNIRAFEMSTGIDVIIDDTPEAVILSGFDPVRREIAKISLERLLADGRIHPGRIEEVVSKAQEEVEENIRLVGEQTCLELGIHGLHPDLVSLLGRLHYRTSYGQNVLQHCKEVAFLTSIMASELGLDPQVAKRAGLLHDIGKAVDHEVEGTHSFIGGETLRKHGENEIVVNAAAAHHEETEATHLITLLVSAADAMSGARPGARRETLENYIKRLENLERIADGFEGVEKSYAIQAGREIRIIVSHQEVDDARAQELARAISRKVEKDLEFPGQIKVVVIRETRAVDYAR